MDYIPPRTPHTQKINDLKQSIVALERHVNDRMTPRSSQIAFAWPSTSQVLPAQTWPQRAGTSATSLSQQALVPSSAANVVLNKPASVPHTDVFASLSELVGQPQSVRGLDADHREAGELKHKANVAKKKERLLHHALRAEHDFTQSLKGPERVAALIARLPTRILLSVEGHILTLQCHVRGWMGRRYANYLRDERDKKLAAVAAEKARLKAAELHIRLQELDLRFELAFGGRDLAKNEASPGASTHISSGVVSLAASSKFRFLVRDSKVLSSRSIRYAGDIALSRVPSSFSFSGSTGSGSASELNSGASTPRVSSRLLQRSLESSAEVSEKGTAQVVEALTARVEAAGVPVSKDLSILTSRARSSEDSLGGISLHAIGRTLQGEGASSFLPRAAGMTPSHGAGRLPSPHPSHPLGQQLATNPRVALSLNPTPGGGGGRDASETHTELLVGEEEVEGTEALPAGHTHQERFIDSVLDAMQAEVGENHDVVVPPEALLSLDHLIPHVLTPAGKALAENRSLKTTARQNTMDADFMEKRFRLTTGGGMHADQGPSALGNSSASSGVGGTDNKNSKAEGSRRIFPPLPASPFVAPPLSTPGVDLAAGASSNYTRLSQYLGVPPTVSRRPAPPPPTSLSTSSSSPSPPLQQKFPFLPPSNVGTPGQTAQGLDTSPGAGSALFTGLDSSPKSATKSVMSNCEEDADVGDSASVVMQRGFRRHF